MGRRFITSAGLGPFGWCFILLGTWLIPGKASLKKPMTLTSISGSRRNHGFSRISSCSPHWQRENKCPQLREVRLPIIAWSSTKAIYGMANYTGWAVGQVELQMQTQKASITDMKEAGSSGLLHNPKPISLILK